MLSGDHTFSVALSRWLQFFFRFAGSEGEWAAPPANDRIQKIGQLVDWIIFGRWSEIFPTMVLPFDRGWGPASDGTGGPSPDQMIEK